MSRDGVYDSEVEHLQSVQGLGFHPQLWGNTYSVDYEPLPLSGFSLSLHSEGSTCMHHYR